MRSFSANPQNIADILGKNDVTYVVPKYQRPYSWGEEQINDFWEDINDKEEMYFLGTFVFNTERLNKYKEIEIIDGQQRLLTLTIAFSVIRDFLSQYKDKEKSRLIHNKYISEKDDDAKDHFKIVPGKSLRVFFSENIQKQNHNIFISRADTEEEKLVKKNYKTLSDCITKYLSECESDSDRIFLLSELRDKIKNLTAIVIRVEAEEDAFNFFETLNARGVELSTADVLKNLMFKNLSEDYKENEIEESWQKIVSNLSGVDDRVDITKFIRHYWLSRYKKINEKKLFRAIKNSEKKGEINYYKLLKDLEKESDYYRKINFPSFDDWRGTFKKVGESLKNIKVLNIKQANSLLLSLVRVMNRPDFDKYKNEYIFQCFDWIENFTFAFSTVAGKSPSPLESIYSEYAIKIHKSKNGSDISKHLKDFKKQLELKYPSKNDFIENFQKISYSKSSKQIGLIKYIFKKINYHSYKEQTFDEANIEHILPSKPIKWGLTVDDVSDFVNNIGNLTILGKEYNEDASNSTISDKIKYYKKSKIDLNVSLVKLLSKEKLWNKTKIDIRSAELAEKAWEVWSL